MDPKAPTSTRWRAKLPQLLALVLLAALPATATAFALEGAGLSAAPPEEPDLDLEEPSWRTADQCEYRGQCRCNSYGSQCYRRDGSSYNQWRSR